MAKMMHDDFEAWIRDRCRACIEESEIDELCKGDLDFDSGDYTFRDPTVQGQWEAWQAAMESFGSSNCSLSLGRIRSSVQIDRIHCKSMANHYAKVDKNNEKWHYWYGRKQVCDEVIAQIDAELLPKPKIENVHPYDSHEPRDYA